MQELFPLSKDDFIAHLRVKHQRPISSGSNSFSSELFPENESTISQLNGHSTLTSPDVIITIWNLSIMSVFNCEIIATIYVHHFSRVAII